MPQDGGGSTRNVRGRIAPSQTTDYRKDHNMFTRRSFIPAFVFAACVALAAAAVSAAPWSFGVISDTQWLPATPENHSVAVNIVDAVNRQFVAAKVDLVLQVGDLTDDGSDAALDTRAAHNRALGAAGIPFYPLRGNHEPSPQAAVHFGKAFPSLPGTPGNGGQQPAAARRRRTDLLVRP